MKTKTISKFNWNPIPAIQDKLLIMSRQLNHQTDQTKLITKKRIIPTNFDLVLIGALKWRDIATTKKWISTYLGIFDTIGGVAPSIEKIIYNMYDLLTSIKYIVEDEGCIIPDAKNVNKTWKGRRREAWGLRTPIMGEIGCWCWPIMTKVQYQRKIAQRCTWHKGNADRVITAALLFSWYEGGFWQLQEHWWWDLWY